MTFTFNKVCFLLALLCFVLAVFSVEVGSIMFIPLGLAFMAAGHLL
jgi:hypothetical protein